MLETNKQTKNMTQRGIPLARLMVISSYLTTALDLLLSPLQKSLRGLAKIIQLARGKTPTRIWISCL